MPAPSDPPARLEAAGATGYLVVGRPEELDRASRRSHLSDGRCVAWTGAPDGVAIDAELDRAVPPALARRFGTNDFWGRWTRLECAAKLSGVPVAVLLRDGLVPARPGYAEVLTVRLDGDVVVSVARRPTASGATAGP